jgi:hypothetical protein
MTDTEAKIAAVRSFLKFVDESPLVAREDRESQIQAFRDHLLSRQREAAVRDAIDLLTEAEFDKPEFLRDKVESARRTLELSL